MGYQEKQYKLFQDIEESCKSGKNISTLVETISDYGNDNKICLTSVVFIPEDLRNVIIKNIIEPLNKLDSGQYYYLPDSLHITLQNIRTVSNPPLFNNDDIDKVKKVFKEVIPKYKSLSFELKGLFELPNSLSIRAYSSEYLRDLRLEIMDKLEEVGVPDNKTYASNDIFFGNSSICRYVKNPNKDFFEKVKELKNETIGILDVKKISLITTNAVCHPNKTKVIEEYNLS